MAHSLDSILIPNVGKVYHLGPSLKAGPLTSVIYFSISGEESLSLDPYNQPAVALAEMNIRVFSITLPGHEGEFPHKHAIQEWAKDFASKKNFINEFIDSCKQTIDFLIEKNLIKKDKLAAMGLSRGAFIATHLAAADERITYLLGFAPLTQLETLNEFENFADLSFLTNYNLKSLIPKLTSKIICFYIGNCDTLVGTKACFDFINFLSRMGYESHRRFPSVELMIYPSIGHKGHGTPPEIFQSGANWLKNCLKI